MIYRTYDLEIMTWKLRPENYDLEIMTWKLWPNSSVGIRAHLRS